MSMWTYIKRGFGYGLGGRLGWELGGAIWGFIRRVVGWLVLAVSAPFLVNSIGAYNDYSKQHAQQQKQQQVQQYKQQDQR